MKELRFFTNINDFTVLETSGGYLHQDNHRRIQLSKTPKGNGIESSSSSRIPRYLRYIKEYCSKESVEDYIYLMLLAHVGEALNGRNNPEYNTIIRQIKEEHDLFEEYINILLNKDLKQDINKELRLKDTLDKLESLELNSVTQITNRQYIKTKNGHDTQVAYGTLGTAAMIVSEKTLRGYKLDFSDFKVNLTSDLTADYFKKLMDLHYEFTTYIVTYLTVFLEEQQSLLY